MASSMMFEDLTPDFSCPVCLEYFSEPVTLPCGHLYCQACIEAAWATCDSRPTCPQCREPFPEKTYVPCKLLGTLIHRIQGLSSREAEEGRCSEADRRVSKLPRDRVQLPVREAMKGYKEELSLAVSQMQSHFSQLDMLRKEEKETLQNHQAIMLSLADHISTNFRQLHHFLYVHEMACKARLEKQGGAVLQETEERLRMLKKASQVCQELLLEAQGHLELADSAEFLTGIHSLLKRTKQQLAAPAVPVAPPVSWILEQFKGALQYVAWREMRSFLNIDFPQITLDPETAHPCLVLSDDYRCVRDGHLRRDVPDTPMRFNYCVAVLGCQGFSSGKHYWEVEVGNKPSWTLGLVSTSINRKGKISASPGNGYWVIRLRNGMELTAKDTPPQRLCPIAFPKRVGVYLDYNAGIASFYDASTMVHLYTFSNPRFTGRLFPYFCPGLYNSGENATPLKICRIPLL
ncbi:zinc-binding protein A33-like [Varanus komodoensis]|uniref:zinc-binding protein A33-like n=1 Tax=Varanus komodoensis TaxID=61221 RepID=UPI001CF7B1ED|nr:zinc-binding protein A33-like [Varanus komodoensis]